MPELTKEQKKKLYDHSDLPPIKNHLLHGYRCFIKLFAFAFVGIGAIFLAVFVFPFIRIFAFFQKKDFGVAARAYVSHTFRFFSNMLWVIQGSKLVVEDKQAFRNIKGKIIVLNHPSILDFVLTMSLVPNSSCIVRGNLLKTPLGGVIKQAYITNTTSFEEMCVECKKVTDQGCNVIIFPEGTRTPRHGRNQYKKGAARIAFYCGCDVQPIFIGGSDKYGLGKYDPFWSYNHVEEFYYDFKLLPVISIEEYKGLTEPVAAKRLTEKIEQTILAAAEDYKKISPCKTSNNV